MSIDKLTEIATIADIALITQKWEEKFFGAGKGFPPIWYRGHADATWNLEPGELREPFVKSEADAQFVNDPKRQPQLREKTINQQFRRMAAQYLPSGVSLVEIYFLAQHHGLPTRLMDWTTNPLAALFFAVVACPEKDGKLFVMNPRFEIEDPDDADVKNYPFDVVTMRHPYVVDTVSYLFNEGDKPANPIILPLVPDQRAGRIFQQGSCFTLRMPDAKPIKNKRLESFLIPQNAKSTLQIQLRRMNINWATLYCDLDNVSKEIKVAWGL